MEIFGVGFSEIILILLIAIIVLGPKDMQKAGQTIGRWLNQLVRSDSWKVFQKTSSEIRNLPRNLMREANIEDLQNMPEELNREFREIDPRPRPPASSAHPGGTPPNKPEPSPQPPTANSTDDDTEKHD